MNFCMIQKNRLEKQFIDCIDKIFYNQNKKNG